MRNARLAMGEVRVIGWKEGFDETEMRRLIVEHTDLGNLEARNAVDAMVDGSMIRLMAYSPTAFRGAARKIGAVFEGDPDVD